MSRKMAKSRSFLIGILVLSCWTAIANAERMIYKDPKIPINHRIKDLMNRMTLEEKIGQMTQIDRSVASTEVMKKYYIGMNKYKSALPSESIIYIVQIIVYAIWDLFVCIFGFLEQEVY